MKKVVWTGIWERIPAEARHRVENELGGIVVEVFPHLLDLGKEEYLPAIFAGARIATGSEYGGT